MKALAMAGGLLAAGLIALPTNARAAQVRVSAGALITVGDDWGRRDWRGSGPSFRYGYDRGWRDGSDEGNRDGRRNL